MTLVLYSALYGQKEPLNTGVFGGFTAVRRVLFTDRTDLEFPGVEIIHDPLCGLDPATARFGDHWFEHVLRFSRRDQISFPYLVWKTGFRYDLITALAWADTVEFATLDRKHRQPDYPRKNLGYQQLRGIWHRLRS